jgi:gliding motility-associated-like protein
LNAPVANGLPAGTYTVDISDTFCTVEATVNITYAPGAQAEVSLGNDTVICPGSIIILSPGHYTSYQWQDNSFDSVFIVSQPGSYNVTVFNSAGCIAADSIRIDEDCLNDIIIPNAFTPNGDGINEHFFVDGSMTSAFEIFIFDRWGELIFNSPDRRIGWDGTAKGHPVQEGFYNYLVNYTIGKEERIKTGSVFVIR